MEQPKIIGAVKHNPKDVILITAAIATVVIGIATLHKTNSASDTTTSTAPDTSGISGLFGSGGTVDTSGNTNTSTPATGISASDLATAISGVTDTFNAALGTQKTGLEGEFTTALGSLTDNINKALGTLAGQEQSDAQAAQTQFNSINLSLNTLNGNVTGLQGVTSLLQQGYQSLVGQTASNTSQISALNGAVSASANQQQNFFTQITTTIQNFVTQFTQGLQTLTNELTGQQQEITALQSQNKTDEARVSGIAAWLNSLNKEKINGVWVLTPDQSPGGGNTVGGGFTGATGGGL